MKPCRPATTFFFGTGGMTVDEKNAVSFCPDISGAITGASQRAKSKRPSFVGSDANFNGNPVFSFNSKSSFLLPSCAEINSGRS